MAFEGNFLSANHASSFLEVVSAVDSKVQATRLPLQLPCD